MSDKKPMSPRSPAVKHARAWLKLMRAEAQARGEYLMAEGTPRETTARKRWLQAQRDWGAIGHNPSNEALRIARKGERKS
jgi:hypothetical protein